MVGIVFVFHAMSHRIVILATGGTIVSSGASSTQLTGYAITDYRAQDLLDAVPELNDYADIDLETVSNIDSSSMNSTIWVRLARRVQELCDDPSVTSIVITHGTDTMEETAYFLHLTVHTDKPIVLTGAMRPSTAISADGPLNLLNAVRTASRSEAKNKGVLVVLNDRILSARDVTKTDPTNVATFAHQDFGVLGLVAGEHIEFFRTPTRRHTVRSEFGIPELPLPRVDILVSHADDDDLLAQACIAAGAQGIVHAGTGNGSISQPMEPTLEAASRKGVFIIRASRVSGGMVVEGLDRWQKYGFIPSGTLSAVKSRILLQLALAHKKEHADLLRIFREY